MWLKKGTIFNKVGERFASQKRKYDDPEKERKLVKKRCHDKNKPIRQ